MHAQVAEHAAQEARQTEEGRRVLAFGRDRIDDPSAATLVSVIGQPFRGWSDGQVWALTTVLGLIGNGTLVMARIAVNARPGPDADRAGNAEKLKAGLPGEFGIEIFEGLSHHGDGELSWPVDQQMPWGVEATGETRRAPLSEWADSAPLEIGYTEASRTLLHLREYGIVARWPYNFDEIWIIGYKSHEDYYNQASAPSRILLAGLSPAWNLTRDAV